MKIALPVFLAFSLCFLACSEDVPTIPEEEPIAPGGSLDPEPGPPVQRQVNLPIGTTIAGFYEALPASYSDSTDTSRTYPLLINVTGAGERGDGSVLELPKVLKPYGPAKLLNEGKFPKDFYVQQRYFAYIVLSIQMVTDKRTSTADLDAFITYATKTYRVDKSRIYLTGISLGAGVVWDYIGEKVEYGRRLAAATPMAGRAINNTIDQARVMAQSGVPVWAFHSEFDTAVPSVYSSHNVEWMNEFSPGLARLTLFPEETTHLCWVWSYNPSYAEADSVNVYEWMLLHHRDQQQHE
jgi:predicted peptidase